MLTADGSAMERRPVAGDLRWDGSAWRRYDGRRWVTAAYSLHREWLTDPAPLHRHEPVDDERRRRALLLAVEDQVADEGGTVVHDGPSGIVVAYRPHTSHVLHAVLTVLTGGLWLVVWLVVALGANPDRVRFEADRWGHVWTRPVRS